MSDIKQSVQDQFARVAGHYRTSSVHAAGPDLEQIAAYVRNLPAPLVLDVGCGAGHVARTVAPWSRQVVAFDLTEAMLAQVEQLMRQQQIANVVTRQGDVEELPFEPASFDLVISRYSAHHWPHPARALEECLRVLRPGGALLLGDIVASEEPAIDSLLQTIEVLRDPSHVRDHRVSEWLALFERVGARAQLLASWDVPIDFESWVVRMATPPDRVAVIRGLLAEAPAEMRQAFALRADGSFTIRGALFEARFR
jgi:ubiquinone/menaquinone biosynthesis C-methylase UbiE